jgi:UDP-N-acetylglucosamine 2-epimerase (non-hydrolysing)
MKKIAFIFGTRPEIIKLAPLINEAFRRNTFRERAYDPILINTGQHKELLYPMLDLFGLKYHYNLEIMEENQTLSGTMGKAVTSISKVLSFHKPDYVVVQGDTTTTFAGALSAFYNGIKVIHIEAGMRTHDLSSPFPEEAHRQMVSKITHLHFCATESNSRDLINEGISKSKVHVVGNTGLDSLEQIVMKELKNKQKDNCKKILLTLHRRESFGEPIVKILDAVNYLSTYGGIKILFPVHPNPNVREAVNKHLKKNEAVTIVNPLDYLSFTQAMWDSDVILSDSGGVQEEAPFLGRPVVVLREKTERTETLGKTSFLVGCNTSKIISTTMSLLNREKPFERDFSYGDGYASQRILDIIEINK